MIPEERAEELLGPGHPLAPLVARAIRDATTEALRKAETVVVRMGVPNGDKRAALERLQELRTMLTERPRSELEEQEYRDRVAIAARASKTRKPWLPGSRDWDWDK